MSDPTQPTSHPRGSPERVEVYHQRAELELPLHVTGDSEEIIPLTHGRVPEPSQGRVFHDPCEWD